MRFVSLFAGIGGFDLGLERAGMTCVGQCEIDPHARAVLERHWPDVPLHGDITTLKGSAFGPAEVVVWGSPCQGLSLAGRRAGLEDERSGLFTEGIRFIRELRHATNDEYPRFSVWENVPGALSSNGGRDFRAVLEAFCEAEVPMPRSGKWANAGVVRGHGREVAWRVLDSQHFGVAQRRRRVFVVADFGGQRAAEVLFEREGVPGDTPQGRTPGQGITGALTGGAGSSSAGNVDDNRAQAGFVVPVLGISQELDAEAELVGTLKRDSPTGGGSRPMVAVAPTVTASWGHHGHSSPRGDGTDPIVPVAFKVRGGKPGGGKGYLGSEDQALTLDTTQSQYLAEPGLPAGTLTANSDPHVATAYAVRRLTPRECERLQAFPDDHTRYDHHGREIADTHRYRLLGNAVTVTVANWIAHRIRQAA